MKLVVDTSVLIAVIANEPAKAELVRVTRGCELVAPASVHWEVGNALAAGLKRRRLSLNEALRALKAYDRIPIRFVGVELDDSLGIAGRLRIYTYDAYVLACARDQRSPLLSLDAGLVTAAEQLGVDVLEV
jgi:predicted nucleic acid-binding protein